MVGSTTGSNTAAQGDVQCCMLLSCRLFCTSRPHNGVAELTQIAPPDSLSAAAQCNCHLRDHLIQQSSASYLYSECGVKATIHVCPEALVVSIIPDVHREAEATGLHCVDVWQAECVGCLQQRATRRFSLLCSMVERSSAGH